MSHASVVHDKLFATEKGVLTYNVAPESVDRKMVADSLAAAVEVCHVEAPDSGSFCVFKLVSGGYLVAWEGHCHCCADEAELDSVLNCEEKIQYRYGVKSA
jgi:hypothetical protein